MKHARSYFGTKYLLPKWREFLGLDKRSLAFFRFCLGLIVMVDTLDRLDDAYPHYSDQGVFPREATLTAHWNWYWVSIHMASGSALYQQFLFLVHAVFAFFMMIGYKTKLSTFMCWFLVSSHQARNNINGHGGDMYMRIILFWAMFLPTSSYFSVDRSFFSTKRRKVKRPLAVCGGTIAVITQVCIVYVFSYLHKTGDEWHVYGTSTHYALMLDYFRLPMGNIFLHFPNLMRVLSFAVLYYELLGSLLFFVPVYTGFFRALGSILFMIMHVGFGSCMGLGIFSPISCTSLSTLLTPWFWDEIVFPWLSKGVDKIQVLYYKNTPGEPLSILLSDFLLLPDTFTVSPSDSKLVDEQFSWLAVERQGAIYTRFEAFEQVCNVSPLLWPIRMLLNFQKARTVIQRIFIRLPPLIGFWYRSRSRSSPTETETPAPPDKVRLRRKLRKFAVSAIAVFLIVHIILWNCGNMHYSIQLPDGTHWIAMVTRLDQMWNMFSPGPPRINWWYTIEGTKEDGTRIEIWRNGLENWVGTAAPYSVAKPENLGDVVGNHRWVKYYEFINWAPPGVVDVVRLNFGRYICREWNSRYQGGDLLWKFNIIFRSEDNLLDGTHVPRMDEVYWSHACFEKIANNNFKGPGQTQRPTGKKQLE